MRQIKLFSESNLNVLEKQVNSWLKEHDDGSIEIKNIEISTTYDSFDIIYTAKIEYNALLHN